jgi:chaperonin GroES
LFVSEMAKRLIPLLNRVLVEKIVPPSKTHAGILLPEKATKLNSGKVVAVGAGIRDREGKLIPVSVKEGDTVLLPEFGGTQVKLGDKEYVISSSSHFLKHLLMIIFLSFLSLLSKHSLLSLHSPACVGE